MTFSLPCRKLNELIMNYFVIEGQKGLATTFQRDLNSGPWALTHAHSATAGDCTPVGVKLGPRIGRFVGLCRTFRPHTGGPRWDPLLIVTLQRL